MTTRDAIELARAVLVDTWLPDNHREKVIARALLAEHERCEKLEAGLMEALNDWEQDNGGASPSTGYQIAALRSLLARKERGE